MTPDGPSFFFKHDVFNEACSCCIARRVAGVPPGAPVPPAPQGRHAASDPHETHSKELNQCSNCFESSAAGIKLLRCAACQTDIYCSKACQKAAWPAHKETCKLSQRQGGAPQIMKDLRSFSSKHRPTLAAAAWTALGVHTGPEIARDNVLLIVIHPRPGAAKRKETAFFAEAAWAIPISELGPVRAEVVEGRVKATEEMVRKNGLEGAFHAVLWCPANSAILTLPTAFRSVAELGSPLPEWRAWMFKRLNDGIVS